MGYIRGCTSKGSGCSASGSRVDIGGVQAVGLHRRGQGVIAYWRGKGAMGYIGRVETERLLRDFNNLIQLLLHLLTHTRGILERVSRLLANDTTANVNHLGKRLALPQLTWAELAR